MLLTTTNILITIAFSVAVILLIYMFLQNRKLQYRVAKLRYQINSTEEKLQLHTIDIDNLIMMLASIHEFGVTATGLLSKEEVSQTVVDTACSIIHSDLASLMLINSENELYIISSKGLSEKIKKETKMKIGEGIAGRVASTGKYIFVENIETDVRFLRPNDDDRYVSKSFISVPLKVKSRVIGVLNINSPKNKKQFNDRDLKLITILADQAAMRLDNIELFNNLQSFYFEMVQTLARAIDAKDAYTYDHADRARKYAKAIAVKMNLPYTIVRNIEYAALMHDIGKIGIADNILLKKEKLTEKEIKMLRTHPIIGNKILAPVKFLSDEPGHLLQGAVVLVREIDLPLLPVHLLAVAAVLDEPLVVVGVVLLLKGGELVKALDQKALPFQVGEAQRAADRVHTLGPGPVFQSVEQGVGHLLIVNGVEPGEADPLFAGFFVVGLLQDALDPADDLSVPVGVPAGRLAGVVVDVVGPEHFLFVPVQRGHKAVVALVELQREVQKVLLLLFGFDFDNFDHVDSSLCPFPFIERPTDAPRGSRYPRRWGRSGRRRWG